MFVVKGKIFVFQNIALLFLEFEGILEGPRLFRNSIKGKGRKMSSINQDHAIGQDRSGETRKAEALPGSLLDPHGWRTAFASRTQMVVSTHGAVYWHRHRPSAIIRSRVRWPSGAASSRSSLNPFRSLLLHRSPLVVRPNSSFQIRIEIDGPVANSHM